MIKLFVFIYGKRMGEQISAIQISKPVFSWNIHKSKYFLPKKILENVIGFQVHVLCIRLYAKNIIWKAIAWVFNVKSMLWPQNDPRMSYCYFFTFFFFFWITAFIRWHCFNNSPVLPHVLPTSPFSSFVKVL